MQPFGTHFDVSTLTVETRLDCRLSTLHNPIRQRHEGVLLTMQERNRAGQHCARCEQSLFSNVRGWTSQPTRCAAPGTRPFPREEVPLPERHGAND